MSLLFLPSAGIPSSWLYAGHLLFVSAPHFFAYQMVSHWPHKKTTSMFYPLLCHGPALWRHCCCSFLDFSFTFISRVNSTALLVTLVIIFVVIIFSVIIITLVYRQWHRRPANRVKTQRHVFLSQQIVHRQKAYSPITVAGLLSTAAGDSAGCSATGARAGGR